MESIKPPQLTALEALRGHPVIIYMSTIVDDSVRIMYECLRKQGRTGHLDLVLSTTGGNVTTARQLALLLREYTEHLTILVPYRARSSGTLLCLSADELVLGPMAELGPIDPHISSAGPPPPDAPGMISALDIRAFREMAEQWFGVTREEDRLQVLALLAQRIFPTSLAAFYRFEQMTEQIANELLAYQLPGAKESDRQQIVNQLIKGYYAHDYVLSRSEARELGLRVRFTSLQEETLLWDLLQASRVHITEHADEAEEECIGLIASTHFSARLVSRWIDQPSWQRSDLSNGGPAQVEKVRDIHWEFDK